MYRSLRQYLRKRPPTDGVVQADGVVSMQASKSKLDNASTWDTKASKNNSSHGTELEETITTSVEASELESESPRGMKVLVPQPADDTGCVDIIAIHGLNGHREKTWIDKTTRLNWLSDENCLPNDVPNARVLTFGYNSRTYFSRSTSNIRDFASELLAGIKANRKSLAEQQRPIVFLCHSLGGLVFKQAMVSAHEQNDHYASILKCTCGVIFFATPHRGSSLAFWDQLGTTLMRIGAFGYSTNTSLSKLLKVDGEMLKLISESFSHRGGQFKIRSFYETEQMPGLNCRIVEKESATLGWPNELDTAASANHSTICKFPSPSDQRYQTTIFAISELIEGSKIEDNSPFDLREEACMRELNSDYEDHLGQVDDPIPETCEWVLSHEKWHRWDSLREPALLWITADAGCGKSVIAKFLVNHFLSLNETSAETSLAYFFFKEGLEDQDNASAAISAVLHQLCCSQRRLIKRVMAKYTGIPKRTFNRFSCLWSILMSIIHDSITKNIVLILDGLDECEEKSLTELTKALATYLDSGDHLAKLPRRCFKVIILSRPHNLIQRRLRIIEKEEPGETKETISKPKSCNTRRIRLIAEEESAAIAKDISIFVRSKVAEFGQNSELLPDMLRRLEERLMTGADYTFLWISLVIKLVEDIEVDGMSMSQLELILSTTKLDDVYERLLRGRALPLKARKALMIVLAAVRPITLKEMCAAIEVHQDHFDSAEAQSRLADLSDAGVTRQEEVIQISENAIGAKNRYVTTGANSERSGPKPPTAVSNLDELEKMLHKPFSNHLRQICGHFLRIRGRKIYLVHQTAREFLLSKLALPPGELRNAILTRRQQTYQDERSVPTATDQSNHWRHSIFQEETNLCLLQICVDTIKLFQTERLLITDTRWTTKEVVEYLKACRDDPAKAFFKYAVFHWVDHYRPLRESLQYSFDYLLNPSNLLFKIWIIVHRSWVPEEERSLLEAGGVEISGIGNEPRVGFHSLLYSGQNFYSSIKDVEKEAKEFEMVLEHFNLHQDGLTKDYDVEYLGGDRYWKQVGDGDDVNDDVDDEDLANNAGDMAETWKIPDRVQYYRRKRRAEVSEWFEEMSNPLSPAGGNPYGSTGMRSYLSIDM